MNQNQKEKNSKQIYFFIYIKKKENPTTMTTIFYISVLRYNQAILYKIYIYIKNYDTSCISHRAKFMIAKMFVIN
jgi:hypothetical protein